MTARRLTISNEGHITINAHCPFQQEAIECGEWCALFVVQKLDNTSPLFKNKAYVVDFMCSPKDYHLTFKPEEVVDEQIQS